MNYKESLIEKIKTKKAIVGIIGLGYVGLPLALSFAEKEFNVIGFDIDEKKIPLLKSGKSYIKHIPADRIVKSVQSKKFNVTNNFSLLKDVDAIIICVPTPLNEHREPDMTFIENTAKEIQKYLQRGQLVTLESTTYPGTTEEILLPLFENALQTQESIFNPLPITDNRQPTAEHHSLTVGKDFFLAFSPEREDPGNKDYSTSTIPKIVGGVTQNCLDVALTLYNQVVVRTIPVSSPRVAEAAKLLENIYRSVNIALVNELKMVFEKMGIDIWEVIEAAKTKPFGFQAFYPGPGLGGHCIPIDPFYLTWKAREYDISTRFIELAGEINTYQPYYVVQRTIEVLNENGKSIKGAKVLILGASYKKNIDDMRESPTLKLIEIFRDKGAVVDYSDPYVPKLPPTRKYKFDMESVVITSDSLARYDLVLLSTDHDSFDYQLIANNSRLIVDTRNAFERHGIKSKNIYRA